MPPFTNDDARSLQVVHRHLADLDGVDVLDVTRCLLEVGPFIVLVLGQDRRVIYSNAYFEQLSGYSLDEIAGQDWFELCLPEEVRISVEPVFERAIGGTPTRGNINSIRCRDGTERLIEWHDCPLTDANDQIVGLVAIGQDITNRVEGVTELVALNQDLEVRRAQRAAQHEAAAKKYQSLVEALDGCVYRLEIPSWEYSFVSQAATDVFGHPAPSFLHRPNYLLSLVAEGWQPYLEARLAEAITGNVAAVWEYEVVGADGRRHRIVQSNTPITSESGALIAIEGIARDVTDAWNASSALHTMNQLLEGTFEASTVSLAYMNRDFDFVRVNRIYADADGTREPNDFIGLNHFDLYPHPENEKIFAQVRDTGRPYSVQARPFEYAHAPERGTTHWDWTLTPVKDRKDRVVGLVLALRDVTDRVRAIEALQDSESRIATQLAEKEVLLREIHHRVKNNLQVVQSILYLQAAKIGDEAIKHLFDESRSRVHAMALVHDVLYRSEDLAHVDFGPYLEKLTTAVHETYAPHDTAVRTEVFVDTPPLDIQVAMPCGLIAGELLTNALKYAFPTGEGELRISVTHDDGFYTLQVEDDGPGFDLEAARERRTLGLRLVDTLTQQLRGRLRVVTDKGTKVEVRFPAQD